MPIFPEREDAEHTTVLLPAQPPCGLGWSSGEGHELASEKKKQAWGSAHGELGRAGYVQGWEENHQRARCTLFTVEIILSNALQV